VLLSAGNNVRATIEDHFSRREHGLEFRLVGRKPKVLRAEIRREIEGRIPWDAFNRSERVRDIASLCEDVIDHIVPNASGFEVTLPASTDLWDSVALRIVLVSSAAVLLLTFKDWD
jgi:hypothetical protein